MQKTILLLPLVCFIFCVSQEIGEAQSLISPQTSFVDPVQLINNGSSYDCPNNYVYLVRDFQIFNGVVCVNTTITDVELQQGNCSPGWDTVSFNEVNASTQQYCNMLGAGDVARIGFRGSLSGNNCALSEFNITSGITRSICVKRVINDVELVPVKGNICGNGQVLVTEQEALVNQNAYCNILGDYDIVRLADGGSMDGPGYGCNIRYEDRRDLFGVLCRALKTSSEPNENENVFVIPEAIFNVENVEQTLSPIQLVNSEENFIHAEQVVNHIQITISEEEMIFTPNNQHNQNENNFINEAIHNVEQVFNSIGQAIFGIFVPNIQHNDNENENHSDHGNFFNPDQNFNSFDNGPNDNGNGHHYDHSDDGHRDHHL
jgi:hypothetical protein